MKTAFEVERYLTYPRDANFHAYKYCSKSIYPTFQPYFCHPNSKPA